MMNRRALLAGIAASAIILTGCAGAGTQDPTDKGQGMTTGVKETPKDSKPSFKYASKDINVKDFVTDLQKANEGSYKSVSKSEDSTVTTKFETVDGVAHIHTVIEMDGKTSENIVIGSDTYVKENGKWSKAAGIVLGAGGNDVVSGYADKVEKVTYKGTDGEGHHFDVEMAPMEGIKSMDSSFWVNNNMQVTRIDIEAVSLDDEKFQSSEVRTDHGAVWNIKAPV